MVQLTVALVAGFIAAAVFVARHLSPNALTFIISSLVRDKSTAATWTVASSALQQSQWRYVVRSDSSYSRGVPKDILWTSRLIPLMGLLLAVTSVVTPLGLYSAIVPDEATQAQFVYAPDASSFGYGTPARSNYSWSRTCTGLELTGRAAFAPPRPCPFSDTVMIASDYGNGTMNFDYPYSYNVSVPQIILDTYSSGVRDDSTVSNYFDIQWRRYTTVRNSIFNNGSRYLVSANRNMQTLVLNNAQEAVEGLVVDSISGGIGFRNHTVPIGFRYGVTWQEDLLFVEPETACVDTNLTLDFTIENINNTMVSAIYLTDRGGFVNTNRTFPDPDLSNTQANADLHGRAYKAAWMNNWLAAAFLNVTNPRNLSDPQSHAFSYMNSEMNKTFPMGVSTILSGSSSFGSLELSGTFGDYLSAVTNTSNPGAELNPFDIGPNNFSVISILCSGVGNGDYANITNILVGCGMMRPPPQRTNPGSELVFEDGSSWSQKMYTCATAVKASVKTVTFSYNHTDGFFDSLGIVNITNKQYGGADEVPTWGVEDTGNSYMMADTNLVWGLVSPEYRDGGSPKNRNVSTVQQPWLYVPGFLDPLFTGGGDSYGNWENMPGSDFSIGALSTAYTVGSSLTVPGDFGGGYTDYTGGSNIAMWARWQQLAKNADTAALIPNLIFTDVAASRVVGTKGVLGPGNNAATDVANVPVTPMQSAVQYHLPYAIPAVISGVFLIGILAAALIAACLPGRGAAGPGGGLARLRRQMQRTSPGRIYTAFLYPGWPGSGMEAKPKEWSKQLADKVVDLTHDYPARPAPEGMAGMDENLVMQPLAYTAMPTTPMCVDPNKEAVAWETPAGQYR